MEDRVDFIGPFKHYDVVVEGRAVPHLSAMPQKDGVVTLLLDRRFAVDIPSDDVDRLVPFIADCIAVAMGYSSHQRRTQTQPVERPTFPTMTRVDSVSFGRSDTA